MYFKDLICISTVHLYRPLCLNISSLTCSALGCLMNMWTFRPPARWAHGLLWWPRTAINNVVFCLVKSLSLFLYCLSEIKFTTTTSWHQGADWDCDAIVYENSRSGKDIISIGSEIYIRKVHLDSLWVVSCLRPVPARDVDETLCAPDFNNALPPILNPLNKIQTYYLQRGNRQRVCDPRLAGPVTSPVVHVLIDTQHVAVFYLL